MIAILRQRKFLITKVFELTDESLKIIIKSPLSYVEQKIEFENLTSLTNRKKLPNTTALIFTLLTGLGVLITVLSHFFDKKDGSHLEDIAFFSIPFLISLTFLYITYENNINLLLNNGQYLSFYANSPSLSEVNDFINSLKDVQKKALLNKYVKGTPYFSPEQQLTNIKWLRERKIINDEEFVELNNKYLETPQGISNQTNIGFKF